MNEKRTIAILVLLLVLAIGYMVMDKYGEYKESKRLETFQQGAQFGYEQAILQLVQQAVTCQPVAINVQNQTLNMIAVDCLQQ